MIWTTETPTKEGWYWFMQLDGSDERIVNVYHTEGGVTGPLTASGKTSIWSISTAIDGPDP